MIPRDPESIDVANAEEGNESSTTERAAAFPLAQVSIIYFAYFCEQSGPSSLTYP